MTARELVARCHADPGHFQLHVNEFVDEFRGANLRDRVMMAADGPPTSGPIEGLVAAVVGALCREGEADPPAWAATTRSPEPFFVMSARGFALRLRLMLESPPPFRARNVFVPESYLDRA